MARIPSDCWSICIGNLRAAMVKSSRICMDQGASSPKGYRYFSYIMGEIRHHKAVGRDMNYTTWGKKSGVFQSWTGEKRAADKIKLRLWCKNPRCSCAFLISQWGIDIKYYYLATIWLASYYYLLYIIFIYFWVFIKLSVLTLLMSQNSAWRLEHQIPMLVFSMGYNLRTMAYRKT